MVFETDQLPASENKDPREALFFFFFFNTGYRHLHVARKQKTEISIGRPEFFYDHTSVDDPLDGLVTVDLHCTSCLYNQIIDKAKNCHV